MTNLNLGQEVIVTIVRRGMDNLIFKSEVVDIVDNNKSQGVYVNHPECEDWLFVDLTDGINTVEVIAEEIEVYENQDMKEIRKEIEKAVKWLDEDDDVLLSVKIYEECDYSTHGQGQTYDVEAILYINGEYTNAWTNKVYYGRYADDEKALKEAKKRANAVKRTVKGWFEYSELVKVSNEVEIYHA